MSDPYAGNRPPEAILELNESLRRLTETAVRIAEVPPEAAADVRGVVDRIDALERRLRAFALDDVMPRMGPEPAGTRPFFMNGVIMGPHHILRPELEIGTRDGITRGTVNFGISFEGPPGCVHGGYVAHFFDQVLGQHNLNAQVPAMTGSLSVRYRKGTPLLRDLDFEVRHEPAGERKVITSGFVAADGEVFAEAEGTFIVPRTSRWQAPGGGVSGR